MLRVWLVRVLVAAVVGYLLASALGIASASAQGLPASSPSSLDVAGRDRLIAEQAALLNTYRCLFGVDTEVVPGGCFGGAPAEDPVPLPAPEGVPTEFDVAVRDRLVAVQEALLNAYRCLFGVDTEVVPGGCPSRAGSPATGTAAPGQSQQDRPLSFGQALDVASRLAARFSPPSGCSLPLGLAGNFPNASRSFYRAGVHQGVDFACSDRDVRAVLDGRVVVAVGDYATPPTRDLDALLATTYELQATPPYTLIMLYGNYVVLDHGVIEGVGHVVSIYAHLESLAAGVRIGGEVSSGDLLGTMGNTGTEPAAAGLHNQGVHLHWELHVNGHYLAKGLSPAETREVYTTLFARPAP